MAIHEHWPLHTEKEKEKEKKVIPSKSPISLDLTQKILGDLKLDYDVVEDLQNMKSKITVFELCKIKTEGETMTIITTQIRPSGCGSS